MSMVITKKQYQVFVLIFRKNMPLKSFDTRCTG